MCVLCVECVLVCVLACVDRDVCLLFVPVVRLHKTETHKALNIDSFCGRGLSGGRK